MNNYYLPTISSLFFIIILLICRSIGPLSYGLSNFIIYILISVFIFLPLKQSFSIKYILVGALSLIGLILLFKILPQENFIIKLFILSLIAFIKSTITDKENIQSKRTDCLLGITAFLFSLFYYLYLNEPILWYIMQDISQRYSNTIGTVTAQPILLGFTASGIHILLLFLFYSISLFFFSTERNWRKLVIFITILIFLNMVFIALLHPFARILDQIFTEQSTHLYHAFLNVHPMNIIILQLVIYIIPLYFFNKDSILIHPSYQNTSIAWKIFIPILLSFMLSFTFYHLTWKSSKISKKKIFIYSKGYLNWDKPEFEKYGLTASGMFGMLPSYLNTMNYEVNLDSTLNQKSTEGTNTILLINLTDNLQKNELEFIKNFVKKGGSLLVLGDHTGLGGIMQPLNQVTDFAGIHYRFDSAHYFKNSWKDAFQYTPHKLFCGINNDNQIGISVGASLNFSPLKAKPLFLARYGFSDYGNPLNNDHAFLGDRLYNPGELIGDIALVVESHYGMGKIIVFGDTSPFQNGPLAFTYQFVQNIFEYLNDGETIDLIIIRRIGGAFFLILGLLLLFVKFKKLIQPGYLIIIISILGIYYLIIESVANAESKIVQDKHTIAYIDASHINRYSIYDDNGIMAIIYNLMRNEYLPFVSKKYGKSILEKSRIAFFISPVKNLKSSEIIQLKNFISCGGVVIWSVGYEEKEGSMNVLTDFGFDIDNVPLGPIPKEETSAGIKFHEAWPIITKETSTIDTLCTGYDYPVIVSKPIGKGRFILISDSGFLLNENIETRETYSEQNIQFFRKLLN